MVVKLPVWAASSPHCFDVFRTGIWGRRPAVGWCLLQLWDGRCEGPKPTSPMILISPSPSSLSRLGLILLLLQYLAEFFFHMARLVYFTDENNEKL